MNDMSFCENVYDLDEKSEKNAHQLDWDNPKIIKQGKSVHNSIN